MLFKDDVSHKEGVHVCINGSLLCEVLDNAVGLVSYVEEADERCGKGIANGDTQAA